MNETKEAINTPTPWKRYGSGSFHGRNYTMIRTTAQIGGINGEVLGDIAWVIDGSIDEREANAAFIVRTVNSHSELLDSLKEAASSIGCVGTDENNDTCGVTFTCWKCKRKKRWEAAIAKAEGRQK